VTRDMADLSMLELFRMEAGNHTQVLESELPGLDKDLSADKIQPLIHAANALKGSGRIVGLADAVSLAGAMEILFESCRKGEYNISEKQIEVAIKAAQFLARLAEVEAEKMDGWLEANNSEFKEILNSLEKRDEVSSNPVETEIKVEKTASKLKNAPHTTAGKKEVSLADSSMLDLFRMEAESHSQSLNTGLLELEKDQAPEKVEPLMRAAHSLKGAARIVGLNDIVTLAHAMEDVLEACRKGKRLLITDDIDRLLAATDFFSEIASMETDQLNEWLTTNVQAMNTAAADLEKLPEMNQLAVPEQVVTESNSEPESTFSDIQEEIKTEKADIPLADLSMLDLFRMEAESHSQSLSTGLLELEKASHLTKLNRLCVRPTP